MSGISDPALARARIYTDLAGLEGLKHGPQGESKLRAAAEQFEAIFTQTLLRQMREALPKGGLFDSDRGRFYEQMFDQQLASSLGAHGGLGLSEILVRQLSQAAPTAAAPDDGGD